MGKNRNVQLVEKPSLMILQGPIDKPQIQADIKERSLRGGASITLLSYKTHNTFSFD
jgi:hypothetical protein